MSGEEVVRKKFDRVREELEAHRKEFAAQIEAKIEEVRRATLRKLT